MKHPSSINNDLNTSSEAEKNAIEGAITPANNAAVADKFDLLKSLLLKDELKAQEKIGEEVRRIKDEFFDELKFEQKMTPHINAKIEYLQENFNEVFGERITASIQSQIKDSKDDLIEALYPIMGKLIQKFVQAEIQKLSDEIDARLSEMTFENFLRRFKLRASGIDSKSIILSELARPDFSEIYVIQKNTGLLVSSYSKVNTVDRDLIAGMLTAIKSFIEDALNAKKQELEMIEYNNFKIFIVNTRYCYFAFVFEGAISQVFRNETIEKSIRFANKYLSKSNMEINNNVYDYLQPRLNEFFFDEIINID